MHPFRPLLSVCFNFSSSSNSNFHFHFQCRSEPRPTIGAIKQRHCWPERSHCDGGSERAWLDAVAGSSAAAAVVVVAVVLAARSCAPHDRTTKYTVETGTTTGGRHLSSPSRLELLPLLLMDGSSRRSALCLVCAKWYAHTSTH